MPWDSGPVAMFYRRDFYEKAGVDPASIKTWDDFIAAGKKIQEANPGVTMTNADFNGDTEFFRMISNEQGCGYFATDGQSITVNQPKCVDALDQDQGDEGRRHHHRRPTGASKIPDNTAGTVATQMYGGWYEGTVRTNAPTDQSGKWGVYLMPSLTADGPRAANLGGSSLAITAASKNKEAACAYVELHAGDQRGPGDHAEGIRPGAVADLGARRSLSSRSRCRIWGGQAVWKDILGTLPKVVPSRGTPFQGDADVDRARGADQVPRRRLSRRQGGARRRRQARSPRRPACRSQR